MPGGNESEGESGKQQHREQVSFPGQRCSPAQQSASIHESIVNTERQVSWLVTFLSSFPPCGSGHRGQKLWVLLTVAGQLVIFTQFPINLRKAKPFLLDDE